MKNSKIFYILFLVIVIIACSPSGRLYKERSRVILTLSVNRRSEPVEIAKRDSANQPPVLNFTSVGAEGDNIPVGMSVEWDNTHKGNLTAMAPDEVVVLADSTRNAAERNGLINVEFIVTAPKVLQQENWMMDVRPVLMGGDVPDSLKKFCFTGQRFRELQERDYRRYDRYVERIIPDLANFYHAYVNYRSFKHYLERLKWYKRRLEELWAIQDARRCCPDPLLLRFGMFSQQVIRRDSLLKEYMLKNSRLMIEYQQWQYDRTLEWVNDTLQPQRSGLRERFRYFDHKWELHTDHQAEELVTRKKYFYDRMSFEPLRQAEHRLYYVRDVDTVPPLWLTAERLDAVQARQGSLANFSEESILAYYGLGDEQTGFTRSRLPLYAYHRNLSDSLQLHLPSRRASRELEPSRFDSVTTVKHCIHYYESLRSIYPQHHLIRELYNIHPPAVRHAALQEEYGNWIAYINSFDSTDLMEKFYNTQRIARNEARKAMEDEKYYGIMCFPFNPDAELDTMICAADQVEFLCSQKVPTDEDLAHMKVHVVSNVLSGNGSKYPLPKSDTLTYLVSSITKFIDKTPRYVQEIIARDAKANTSVSFYFPRNGFNLDETIAVNRKGVKRVKNLTLALMTDPVYRIGSLTLFASSSPEDSWRVNGEIAQKHAKSIHDVLVREFTALYGSLSVGVNVEMDEADNLIHHGVKDEIPDLPNPIRIHTIPEGWSKLHSLIVNDADFKGHKDAILRIIDREQEPDRREWLIKSQYKSEYAYMLEGLYSIVRAVDFRFSLSRREMKQDTIYTNKPDTTYTRAVKYLGRRKYEQALEMLYPYDDINTVIVYISLGYDKATLRIFEKSPQTADNKYMQAILQACLRNEEKAVRLLLGAVDMNAQMKFRANLDPELSELVKKYGLPKGEEDGWDWTGSS